MRNPSSSGRDDREDRERGKDREGRRDYEDCEERNELDALFEKVSRYFALLAEPMRIRILHTICDGERHVGDIVASVGGTQTNVSRHLAALYRAEVVYRRKAGNQVFYGIKDAAFVALCRGMCVQIAARLEQGERSGGGLRRLAQSFGDGLETEAGQIHLLG